MLHAGVGGNGARIGMLRGIPHPSEVSETARGGRGVRNDGVSAAGVLEREDGGSGV